MIRSSKGFVPKEVIVEEIMRIRGLRRNVAFDVGAGSGYLTAELAKVFKKVYAVERNFEIAAELWRMLKELKIGNVGVIVSEIPPEEFRPNLVLFCNVLHEMGADVRGRWIEWSLHADFTVVVEWLPNSPIGPRERLNVKELEESGLRTLRVRELKHHYIAVLRGLSEL